MVLREYSRCCIGEELRLGSRNLMVGYVIEGEPRDEY